MTLQQKTRVAWIDIAKCLTIILVVLGHTLRGGTVQRIVYSFHVTAFFFLSGMTCRADRVIHRIKTDFLRIMVPYYCFGIISILIFAVLGEFAASQFSLDVNTSWGNNLLELLYACPKNNRMKFNMPLWFLPCLFATKMIYYALHQAFRGKQTLIVSSSVLLTALSFVYTYLNGPSLPFNISVSLKMLSFFALGRVCFLQYSKVSQRLTGKLVPLLIGLVLLAVTAVVACIAPQINYSGDTFPSVIGFVITSVTGCFGICFLSMGIRSKILEHVGKSTLAILVMHKFPVLLIQTVGPQKSWLARYNSIPGVAVAVVGTLITIGLCLAVEKFIVRFLPFLLGDFSWLKRTKKRKDDTSCAK